MKTSQRGIELIQEFEGCVLTAYQDGGGVWTIGYGHTAGVQEGQVITQQDANEFLCDDLEETETAVDSLVDVPVSQNEFDALVSFTYNLGQGNLGSSTLLKLLNSGNPTLAADEFPKWNLVAGEPSDGLTRRREAERSLFLEGLEL
jgi:lysozyme